MPERPLPPPSADPQAWETIVDPEQMFTILTPRGWQSRAWVKHDGPIPHQLVTAASPDGSTALFLGDATIPHFIEPAAVVWSPPPGTVVRPYTSIEHFLPGYVQHRFGGLPGFRPGPMAPSQELFQLVGQRLQRAGAAQIWVTAGRIAFSFEEGGRQVQALLFGSSANIGGLWMVEVCGVSTVDDPAPFAPALLEMLASQRATPAMQQRQMQERATSAAQHQATMSMLDQNAAILRANHQQSMATLQGMATSHQAHMASLHASHDARNAAWQGQQAAQDAAHQAQQRAPDDAHRRFLNWTRVRANPIHNVVQRAGSSRMVFNFPDGTTKYLRVIPAATPGGQPTYRWE